jgi:small subunit ribosomal protein S5
MNTETKINIGSEGTNGVIAPSAQAVPAPRFGVAGPKKSFGGRPGGPGRGGGRGGPRGGDRVKSEYDQKILNIRRVTRVVSGGRRMSFAVSILIGDKKGSVGVGTGKAADTALAINKAVKSAKKHLLKVKMTKKMSIPHDVEAKYSSGRVMLMPNYGRGIVAGSAVRDILVLAGIKDITSKIYSGSKNKLNIARAVIKALSQLKAPPAGKVAEVKAEALNK